MNRRGVGVGSLFQKCRIIALVALVMACGFVSFGQSKIAFAPGDSIDQMRVKIKHNGYNFTVGDTWVYNLSPEEKARMFPLRVAPPMDQRIIAPNTDVLLKQSAGKMAAASFDWRNYNGNSYVGAVRNQGSLGSCYSFGACSAAETTYNFKKGLYGNNCVDFAEMYIIWTLGSVSPYNQHYNRNGDGESADYDYYELYAITKDTTPGGSVGFEGVCYEAAFPYSTSKTSPSQAVLDASKLLPRVQFKQWTRVYPANVNDTTEQIKTAISTYGAVDAAVLTTDAFMAYTGGIYQDTYTTTSTTPYYYATSDHAISLVGWNDADQAWILRNSWGSTNWGESGYMRIKYFSAGVNFAVCYLEAESAGAYTISGTISGDTQSGVLLSVTGTSTTSATSVAGGTYTATGLGDGTYTVTPSKSGYTFNPVSRNVTIAGGNQSGVDFVATSAPMYSISGTITLNNGAGRVAPKFSNKNTFKEIASDNFGAVNKYEVARYMDSTGREVVKAITPVKPPEIKVASVNLPKANLKQGTNTLAVPAFDWTYGCTATAAGMMFGYYDRNGYPNMWADGTCPLDNSQWGQTVYPETTCGECPFIASHDGNAGRATKGFVDDYWVDYGSDEDPYFGNWTQHTPQDCTGDFMRTGQYEEFGNTDGSTTLYYYQNGDPFNYTGYGDGDGTYGMATFVQSKGYTVTAAFTQLIQGEGTDPNKGFTFANYQSEIDAGRPVLIQVQGHSMLGCGYDTTGSIVYLHDTWDYSTHQMTWGGSYSNMAQWGVTVMRISGGGGGGGLAGVTVSDGARSDVTDADGNFEITGVPDGTYTVTPSLQGYTFTPATRVAVVNGAAVTGCDFTASQGGNVSADCTIGTTFTINYGVTFDKKPTVYVTYLVNNKLKKKTVKVTDASKDYPSANINCLWNSKGSPGDYTLCVKGTVDKVKVDDEVGTVTLLPPEITGTSAGDYVSGETVTATGTFFGTKPKVWLEYKRIVCAKEKVCKKTCKVPKDTIFFDEVSGDSSLDFVVPNLKGDEYDIILYIDSGTGQGIY